MMYSLFAAIVLSTAAPTAGEIATREALEVTGKAPIPDVLPSCLGAICGEDDFAGAACGEDYFIGKKP